MTKWWRRKTKTKMVEMKWHFFTIGRLHFASLVELGQPASYLAFCVAFIGSMALILFIRCHIVSPVWCNESQQNAVGVQFSPFFFAGRMQSGHFLWKCASDACVINASKNPNVRLFFFPSLLLMLLPAKWYTWTATASFGSRKIGRNENQIAKIFQGIVSRRRPRRNIWLVENGNTIN